MWRRWMIGVVLMGLQWAGVEDARGQDVTLGLKGGFTSTTIAWSPSPLGSGLDELERGRGFSGGLSVSWAATPHLRLRVEGLLSQKGFTEIQGDGDRVSLDLGYLEIPVFVGLALAERDAQLTPEVYAGPWIGFETSCKAGFAGPGVDLAFECNEVPDDPVLRQTTDWGIAAGGLLEMALSPRVRGNVDLRYTMGLRNIDGAPDIDNVSAKHRGLSVMVGFGVSLGS